jgi:hypothetical protein
MLYVRAFTNQRQRRYAYFDPIVRSIVVKFHAAYVLSDILGPLSLILSSCPVTFGPQFGLGFEHIEPPVAFTISNVAKQMGPLSMH